MIATVVAALLMPQNPGQDVTKYVAQARERREAVRTHYLKFSTGQTRPTDKEMLALGNDAISAIGESRALLRLYKGATTRFGTTEEFDLVVDTMEMTLQLARVYAVWGGVAQRAEIDQETARTLESELAGIAKTVLAEELEERLEIEGLADLLTARSFDEAKDAIGQGMQKELLKGLNRRLRDAHGFGLMPTSNLGDFIRVNARHVARQSLKKLLISVLPNQFVVSFLADKILDWIGPKLKEALRNKDDFAERTARTLAGWERHRRRLNAFPPDARLSDVIRAVEQAEAALKATKYLDSDLAQTRQDVGRFISQMEAAREHLERTIRLTRARYMLDTKLAQTSFDEALVVLDQLEASVRSIMSRLRPEATGTGTGETPPPPPPVDQPTDPSTVVGNYASVPRADGKDGGKTLTVSLTWSNGYLGVVVQGTDRQGRRISYEGWLTPKDAWRGNDRSGSIWYTGNLKRPDGTESATQIQAKHGPGQPFTAVMISLHEPGTYFYHDIVRR